MQVACRRLSMVVVLLLTCAPLAAQDNAGTTGDATAPAGGGVFSWQVLEKAGLIGIIIATLAFVLLTLVIYYLLTLRHGIFIPTPFLTEVAETMKAGQAGRVMEICQTDSSLLSRALAAGLNRRRDGYGEMIEAAESVGQEESMQLHQNVGYLALIGTVSPMLGLLGTVYGMIDSFRTVAEQAGYLQPGRLAGGIYTALTTTLLGLIVAIPAMASHVYFRNRVLNLLNETAVVVEELLYPFKKGKFKEVPTARPANAPTAPQENAGAVRDETGEKPPDTN